MAAKKSNKPGGASSSEIATEDADNNQSVSDGGSPDVRSSRFFHCPYRQATLLQQALTPDKMRVAFFIGAGCPGSIRVESGTGTKALIPNIAGLTEQVRSKLQGSARFRESFGKVSQRIQLPNNEQPNVEHILSHVRALCEVVGTGEIDGLSREMLSGLDKEICQVTNDVVNVRLPGSGSPYHHLASWIGSIPRTHPIEIFTTNYDLLMEQSMEECRVPYFDGFIGSDRTFFDVPSIEQDRLPSRWARLWKVHGSVNWWRTNEGEFQRREKGGEFDRQMIHPSHLKYDQSRRMPYLAMLDRMRNFLAHGQSVIITCGYSFSDLHLNEVILQGLSGNPTAMCFGLLYEDRAKSPEAVARARLHANLSLLAADGAVLGTIERDWRSDPKVDHFLHGLAVETGEMRHRTQSPSNQCKFLLGDFKSLGEFLAGQLPGRAEDEGNSHAS